MGSKKGSQLKYIKVGYVLVLKRCQIKKKFRKKNKRNASMLNTVLKPNVLPIKENCKNFETRLQNVVFKTNTKIKQTKGRKNKKLE